MATFEATNLSAADVPAPRDAIWAVVTSPDTLAELTPLIERITADGDRWRWQLRSISALGVSVAPSFTEQMTFQDRRRLVYEHRPPAGRSERAGARGTYTLDDLPGGGTHLEVNLTLTVELPLPGAARPAVTRVMESMMARTGERFARNLYAHLGLPSEPEPRPLRAS